MCRVLGNILCNHDPKVKIKSKNEGIRNGVPSTHCSLASICGGIRCQLWEHFNP